MKWLLLLCLLCNALEAARSESAYDPAELLLNVRKKVVATVDRPPNYLCKETVDRSMSLPTLGMTDLPRFQKQSGPEAATAPPASCDYLAKLRKKPGWGTRTSESDRLVFDVAVSNEGEMYSLVGENHFRANSPADLFGTGLSSTGAFGIFLKTIFASDAANFTYRGDTNSQGRTLAEFGYSVAAEQGGYSIETTVTDEYHQTKKYSAIVPYDGTSRAAHSPNLVIALQRNKAANYNGSESENNTVFSGCHEFGSESTLSFGPPATGQPVADATHPAETPALAAAQQQQLVAIRRNVMATVERLPKYLCTETIDRSMFLPLAAVAHTSCNELAAAGRRRTAGFGKSGLTGYGLM